MKNVEEFINKICENNNYDELLLEIKDLENIDSYKVVSMMQ